MRISDWSSDVCSSDLGWGGRLARVAATDFTPIVWTGFLLAADGLLEGTGRSPLRARPRRFALCWLASIPLWLAFDWVNFSFLHAWSYHGLAEARLHRWLGFAFAFGAIGPAMFLAAEAIRRFGPGAIRWRRIGLPPTVQTGRASCRERVFTYGEIS